MKNAPNSKANLDRAIQRFSGDILRANQLRNLMANSIVAQMIGDLIYNAQKKELPVLPTVDEAIAWANELIERIDNA